MNEQDYTNALRDAFTKVMTLSTEREQIDIQLAKLKQYIFATINMLPDEKRDEWLQAFEDTGRAVESMTASLTEAIKRVLQDSPKQWLTVAQVRDRLKSRGFDFSLYASNPLSSVSTTLRRMKPREVETTEIEGVTSYRWNVRQSSISKAFREAKLKSFGGAE